MANLDVDAFSEDDEPVEKIVTASGRGEKRLTKRRDRGSGEHVVRTGGITGSSTVHKD